MKFEIEASWRNYLLIGLGVVVLACLGVIVVPWFMAASDEDEDDDDGEPIVNKDAAPAPAT